MIDEKIKVEKRETQEYPPLPENIYQVELLDVNAEKKPTYETRLNPEEGREYETVLNFQFTILAGKDKEEDLRGRNVWINFVPTYLYVGKKGKNKLFKIIESLLGRELEPEEEVEGIDTDFLNKLIGKQCRVGTKHKKSGEKIFDNVESYYNSEKDLTSLTDEERDKAAVKNRGVVETPVADEEAKPDEIPF